MRLFLAHPAGQFRRPEDTHAWRRAIQAFPDGGCCGHVAQRHHSRTHTARLAQNRSRRGRHRGDSPEIHRLLDQQRQTMEKALTPQDKERK
jgi:hypothetical protein